jgi:pimeloyl-ACP methyl ester carboxylesterase
MENTLPRIAIANGHRLPIDDVELYVDQPVGEGDPLVLIHGGWTDHTTWSLLVPSLTPTFRVFRYDRRGHSRSARGASEPTRRRHEDDLAAVIEALECAPANLVGTSYGAVIALALAGRRPDLVRSVVAHEPPVLGVGELPAVEALFGSVRDQIVAGDPAAATRRFFEEAVLGPGGWELVPERVRGAAIANAQTFVDMLADPEWAALDVAAVSRFPGPMLVTYGDAGPTWLPQLATATAERIGCPTLLIPGAGHTPHHTHPEALAAIVAAHAPRAAG